MLEGLLSSFSQLIISLISTTSYFGLTILMALQSANVPIPSEVILPYSGFLVSQGKFNLWLVVIAAALGSALGAAISAWLGGKIDELWFEQSKWWKLFIDKRELESFRGWLGRSGPVAVVIAQFIPIVRTYAALAAGFSGISLWRTAGYTLVGSLGWSALLTYIGLKLGENWTSLDETFRRYDYLVIVVILVVLALLLYRRVIRLR